MSYRPFFQSAAFTVALILSGLTTTIPAQSAAKPAGKVAKQGKPDKGDKANKPAKVAWNPARIEMDDVDENGVIAVDVSADKEVLGASLFASGSLRGVIGLPDTFDIPAGETVTIELELLETPEEAGRTIGGTIQITAGGKHLAKPLAFSLKRPPSDTDGTTDETEDEDDPLVDDSGKLPVSWLLDGEDGEEAQSLQDITLDLFDSEGTATVTLVANRDLENLGLWFTPSSSACISAAFDTEVEQEEGVLEFDDEGNIAFIAAGTEVPVLLVLSNPDEWTCGGGTLHVRSVEGSSRSYPQIVGVRIEKGAGVEEEEPEEVAPVAIVDAASFTEEPIAAAQIISIFGAGLGSDDPTALELDESGKVSGYLNGTMVLFDGHPAPLLSVSAGQINAIVPSAVSGGDVEVQVLHNENQSVSFPVPVGPPTPSLFTLSGGQAAAINSNGTLNSNSNPARSGTVISLFGTGAGPLVTPLADGAIASEAIPLAGEVRIFIGGVEADVQYAGTAPGLVAAAVQFNVRINAQTPKGPQPVVITVENVESNATAKIYVQ